MSIRNLQFLFSPRSIAVVGASNRPGSVGSVILRNLLVGGFGGPVLPVNPAHEALGSVLAYPDVASLPLTPDLAVICTPPDVVPGIIGDLAGRGTRAAIVVTAAPAPQAGSDDRAFEGALLEAGRGSSMRILGPNCLGLMVPGIGLNATFAHLPPLPGKIAFVSQSGALCTAVLDWAHAHRIGFSCFVSMGNMADVDFGDMLDYLGGDPATDAILLYMESVTGGARKFMSAARAAARNKPVLAIKAGRRAEGARAAASHTGALAGMDAVYDAAIRRAGMLRVYTIEELFGAVETLSRSHPIHSDRLVIVTNGGGPGVLAADALAAAGGRLADLRPDTIERLDAVLPLTWSRGNPVDLIGDADADRYARAMEIILEDEATASVLVLHVPTAISSSEEAAQAVADLAHRSNRNVLTSWLGRETVEAARSVFAAAGIPTYDTPEQAIQAFMHLVDYRRNQEALTEVPASLPDFDHQKDRALRVVQGSLDEGRTVLTEPESKAVLEAYGIPVVATRTARRPQEAADEASAIGFPVVLKILSPDVTHKSQVGGVALDLETPEAVVRAAAAMEERLAALRPDAVHAGFTVQRMVRRPDSPEVLVGAATDPVFGPVVMFGHGGTAVELIADRALGLPPLNMKLAAEMISRTAVGPRIVQRDEDRDSVCEILVRVSQLIIEIPEIREVDINPLWMVPEGILALDARIVAARPEASGSERLAIVPYPSDLEEGVALESGRRLELRPIRPEDEPAHQRLLARMDPDDVRFRFFGLVREMPHSQMARYTQIDYNREMAFIATAPAADGEPETLGVVRGVFDPDNVAAEFGIIVRSDMKGQGLGRLLLEKLIRYCRARGTRRIVGQVMAENTAMLQLARTLGFEESPVREGIVEVRLQLA